MSRTSNARVFFLRAFICLLTLSLGFWILTPTASMQDEDEIRTAPAANSNVASNYSSNYRPVPEPTVTVRGRIIFGETGRPLRRAGFILLGSKGMGGGGREFSGVTNERGEFEIKNVREGRYFVSVSTPGVLSPFSALSSLEGAFSRSGNAENAFAEIAREFQEIAVSGNGDVDVTIMVRRGAAIGGRIMYADGEPAAGVRVEVLRRKNGQFSAVVPNISEIFGALMGGGGGGMKTDDRGVFRVAGLPAGEYVVRVVENATHGERGGGRDEEMFALLGLNPNSMLATYFPNTPDVKQAEVIKLEVGQEAPEINIMIPDRSLQKVGIIVLNKTTRQPLKGVRVSLKSKEAVNTLFGNIPDFGSNVQTDEQGRLNFKELPTGKYNLIVQAPYSYETPEQAKPNAPKPPKLARTEKEIVVEDKDIEDLVIEMGYGATLSGTIKFEKNEDLPPSLYITAADQEKGISEGNFIGYDYQNGKPTAKKNVEFKIEGLPNGKFFLDAGGARYESGTDEESGFYVKSILFNGKEVRSAPLEVKEGDALKGVQIILSKDLGKLKGKVTRADKSPVVGAKISFVPVDKEKWANSRLSLFAVTNGDGEYEVSGAPDEYFVIFVNAEDETKNEEDKDKPVAEQRRAWLERKTSGAEKVTIKAKQTETANFKLP